MTAERGGPIVVGVDGSPTSYTALDWAVAEARRHQAPLRLVHVADTFDYAGAGIVARQVAAGEILAKAEASARSAAPELDVSAESVDGHAAGRLVAESTRAWMVVVGNRGLGGFNSLLAGSVGVQLAAHARCPVVIVRPHLPPADAQPHHGVGRVVVGIDGSERSDATLEFAFQEAASRGVGVTAVHASSYPLSASPGDLIFAILERTDLGDVENMLLSEALAPFEKRYPDVPVQPVPLPGRSPAPALIHESAGAELLVLGSRGHGGFAGLLLGSVSHAAIHHAACPVAVIHP